ncbi:nucleotidyltransferase domain-containing protein [Bacillus cereus]|uniref:nucleotidyltransferase domain-containing protein n=1 Tax=Bacillus cereus TaxID=1396 RepID=UPI000BED27EA|nr:nucleotidyltransferase domain-containing protein [Bacillus cereus]PEF16000.1 DNA polymerase III subunit beta [Bacillus cereus]PET06763.1 DNA polymerase III subunit beta [Bacillus cereus]PEV92570.1 DNA polymerase III subunit beta [Bacillus cereus]PFP43902.1 DNA polymerase III subunit beta [Bacillus cereus]
MELGLEDKIRKYLVSKYQCHSVIVYGSYANGDYSEDSDIDLLCFTDVPTHSNDINILQEKQLDAWIYPTEKIRDITDFLRIQNGYSILDERGLCANFLNQIQELYQQGPEPLQDTQKEFLREWLNKMLKRSERGDIEGNFRFHWLLVDSLEIYCNLHDTWYFGPKRTLKWMSAHDTNSYRLFEKGIHPNADPYDVTAWIAYITQE